MSQLKSHLIGLRESNLFDELFLNYMEGDEKLKEFYSYTPSIEGLKKYIESEPVFNCNRQVLYNELVLQYAQLKKTEAVVSNIEKLKSATAYTITTGHQLCLFTGPLFFVYKILSTIVYAEKLNKQFSDKHFVPLYWMATEDHDVEEINHTWVYGKKVSWKTEEKGRAGELSTGLIEDAIQELALILGNSENAQLLINLFKSAYLNHTNIADATRYLVNELFGRYGLLVLDANKVAFKKEFLEEMSRDVFENRAEQSLTPSIKALEALSYKIQVNPRSINCFYALPGLRERIEKRGNKFFVLNTDIHFTEEELHAELNAFPERFSPNVVMRPLYQQKILPNIAYIGGPGEIAYWLEYKEMFKAFDLVFPVVLPRTFVLFVDKNSYSKIKKLGLELRQITQDTNLIIKHLIALSDEHIELKDEVQRLNEMYEQIKSKIILIDKSLLATADSEKQKAMAGIASIEQKIVKALKFKNETKVNQIKGLKEKLFPNNVPQERVENFSSLYVMNNSFIEEIKNIIESVEEKQVNYMLVVEDV